MFAGEEGWVGFAGLGGRAVAEAMRERDLAERHDEAWLSRGAAEVERRWRAP